MKLIDRSILLISDFDSISAKVKFCRRRIRCVCTWFLDQFVSNFDGETYFYTVYAWLKQPLNYLFITCNILSMSFGKVFIFTPRIPGAQSISESFSWWEAPTNGLYGRVIVKAIFSLCQWIRRSTKIQKKRMRPNDDSNQGWKSRSKINKKSNVNWFSFYMHQKRYSLSPDLQHWARHSSRLLVALTYSESINSLKIYCRNELLSTFPRRNIHHEILQRYVVAQSLLIEMLRFKLHCRDTFQIGSTFILKGTPRCWDHCAITETVFSPHYSSASQKENLTWFFNLKYVLWRDAKSVDSTYS